MLRVQGGAQQRPVPRAVEDHQAWPIDRAAVSHPNPGRAPVHRLNRAEYSNAIRDLLAVDVRPGEWLPVDDSGYGFDNIAAVLSTSPALLERYMSAARKVSRLAVGDLTTRPVEEIYDAKRDPNKSARNEQLNDDLPFGSRAGMSFEHYFPVDAEYVFTLRVNGGRGNGAGGPDPDAVDVETRPRDAEDWIVPEIEAVGTQADPRPALPTVRRAVTIFSNLISGRMMNPAGC